MAAAVGPCSECELNSWALMKFGDRIESLLDKADLPNSESKFVFYFLNCKLFLEEFGN